MSAAFKTSFQMTLTNCKFTQGQQAVAGADSRDARLARQKEVMKRVLKRHDGTFRELAKR
jgi:hypothetical protein